MKKVVRIFVLIIIAIFISIYVVIYIDKKSINSIEKDIIKNTDIKDIEYINIYGDNYIVMDIEYIYLLDDKYEEIYKLDIEKVYDNKENYDIVYRNDLFMYMDSYNDKDGVKFKYYDIESYEFVDEMMVGGN